jgi:hypothetical protein
MTPLIIDDYLSTEKQNNIKQLMLDIPWTYSNTTTSPGFTSDNTYNELPMLKHYFIRDGAFISDESCRAFLFVNAFCDILKIDFKSIVRINAHMWFSNKRVKVGPPHIDDVSNLDYKNKKYITLLYYVHDCDGDTVLYDYYGVDDTPLPPSVRVQQTITPRQGRIAIFDSNQYHSNGIPSYGARQVINCVFEV